MSTHYKNHEYPAPDDDDLEKRVRALMDRIPPVREWDNASLAHLQADVEAGEITPHAARLIHRETWSEQT